MQTADREDLVRPKCAVGSAGFVVAIGIAGAVIWSMGWTEATKSNAGQSGGQTGEGNPKALPALPPPDLLRPLTPAEAQIINAKRPILDATSNPAAPFHLIGNQASKMLAIDCLSQAIYYEAASEGVDGGRAIAQVVLNRVRHPGYPNSICAVVYQGSNRTTGCQFTFTCDGSIARAPVAYLWARSRRIAAEALAGKVFMPIGHATH